MGERGALQTCMVGCLIAAASAVSFACKGDGAGIPSGQRPPVPAETDGASPARRSSRREGPSPEGVTITVLYNNVPHDTRLQTAWGMSCLIEGVIDGADRSILFDTGGDGRILLSNMTKLRKRPEQVDVVVLSHVHGDHVGGLWEFLRARGDVRLYVPESFPSRFKSRAEEAGARVCSVGGSVEIEEGVWSTGQMGTGVKEQALVLGTPEGLVVVTGCAHPGVVNVVRKAKEIRRDEVRLVTGGFHLAASSRRQVERIMRDLRLLGVEKVGPSHCTGERPIEMFRETWGEDFVEAGCGAVIAPAPSASSVPAS